MGTEEGVGLAHAALSLRSQRPHQETVIALGDLSHPCSDMEKHCPDKSTWSSQLCAAKSRG